MRSEQGKSILKDINSKLKLKKGYLPDTKRTIELDKRIKEYNFNEVQEVVDFVFKKWSQWDKLELYFNPTTLFRKKNFDRYHEEMEIEKEKTKNIEQDVPKNDLKRPLIKSNNEKGTNTFNTIKKIILTRFIENYEEYNLLDHKKKLMVDDFIKLQLKDRNFNQNISIKNFIQEIKYG